MTTTNRLAGETSPYLLQHATNPVDWYPWGDEALARARAEDKPILLSIGYAACHWCHVMERESFTDPEIARVMNERFVPIKVDREERPDLDAIYMAAVQAMTGHGGWPMTVFLTPDQRPFWGGTYFPPAPRQGMPSFRQVLDAIAHAWANQRDEITTQSEQLTQHVEATLTAAAPAGDLDADLPARAARGMLAQLDDEWGGFGGAPKFPQPMTLSFLLRMHAAGIPDALPAVALTLDRMARGGIFDQIGGGFHRYAVDRIWLVPHFEKMLYDNGLLLSLYADAYAVTGSSLYRRTLEMTGAFLEREMQLPQGGFASSLDADSEGEEGRFYVWPYHEIIAIAGDDMPLIVSAFALAGTGNWEGTNVLWRPQTDEEVAADTGASPEEVRAAVDRVSERLLAARAERERPATDDKVIAAWNGFAIEGLARAGRVLGRPDFIETAARAAAFVLEHLRDADGRLQRSWRDGATSGPAFLDDHAAMASACLSLYEATFDVAWWRSARGLVDAMRSLFTSEDGFHDTGRDAATTIVRPRDMFDNAVPSGNAVASDVLLRMAALAGDDDLREHATRFLRTVAPLTSRAPLGFGAALSAIHRTLSPSTEIAIVGDPTDPDAASLRAVPDGSFLPNAVLAGGPPDATEPPVLADRRLVDGGAAAYVCHNFTCDRPVASPADLERSLRRQVVNS